MMDEGLVGVTIQAGSVRLPGALQMPARAKGIVVFAHGSGSSHNSPRNRYVARQLIETGLGTLLFDLLTPTEELDPSNKFDVDLLSDRLTVAIRFVAGNPELAELPMGLFGSSTGAAGALAAAANDPKLVRAVVSRGGRPDLASDALPGVAAPTLLLVGELDEKVLELNKRAYELLACKKNLVVVPGAGHLFEEAGALERVVGLAAEWFSDSFSEKPGESGLSQTA